MLPIRLDKMCELRAAAAAQVANIGRLLRLASSVNPRFSVAIKHRTAGRNMLTLRVLFITAFLWALLMLLVGCCCWLSASLLFCMYSFRREATDVDSERIVLSKCG